MMYADKLFENATFVTMEDEGHCVEAVATYQDSIVYAGDRAGAEEYVGAATQRVDLGGATVFPGFADPHTHLVSTALSRFKEIDFDRDPVCRSIADVQDRIRARAATTESGRWILGVAVRDERYVEKRYPTRHELDAAAPDHPVAIRGTGGHVVCANSLALRIAGIDRNTPDPPGGAIDRDADGEPNGILRERGKLGLVQGREGGVIPPYTFEDSVECLAEAARTMLAAEGITAINVMVVEPSEIRAFQEARRRGVFPIRTKLLVRVIESAITLTDLEQAGIQTGMGDAWVSYGGVKMSIDGGSLQRNAAMYEPYPGHDHNCGLVRIEQDELDETTAKAHRLGLRNVVHAIGDRAYDMALTALEKGLAGTAADHRSRIEHLGNLPVTDTQIDRAKELGVIASPQPPFIWTYGDKWLDIFGEQLMESAFPFRRMLDSGLPVIASSDFGMSPTNPLIGIQAAVTRRTEGGAVIGADQAITPYEALQMYTSTSAWSDFDEAVRGTITVGKYADLTVLGADPLTAPPLEISAIPIVMTVAGGRIVHSAQS